MWYESYPWALAPAFDPTRSEEERNETLNKFFAACMCCLDPGLCRALRARFPDVKQYGAGTKLATFLTVLFLRLVVTSTQVELQFSKYSQLTNTNDKRLGLAGLASRAVNNMFKQQVGRWRAAHHTRRLTPGSFWWSIIQAFGFGWS